MSLLNKQDVEDIFEITPLQEGLLFHYLKDDKDGRQNFEQICLTIEGTYDPILISKAWNLIIQRHGMLRTVFRWKKLNKPVQITLRKNEIAPDFFDLSALSENESEERLQSIKDNDKACLFDLELVPFRISAVKMTGGFFVLMISNHSIIYDGWSNSILLKEFFTIYPSLLRSASVALTISSSFKDFVKAIKKRDVEKERIFWTKYFAGRGEKSDLIIKSANTKGVLTSTSYSIKLPVELVQAINEFSISNRVTKASIFYAIWGILLQKISNSSDVVFGTTVAGRSVHGVNGIEGMIGLLINTLPVRVCGSTQSVNALVKEISAHLALREEFETTPLLKIKEYAGCPLGEDLFDSIVLIENYPMDTAVFKSDPSCRIKSFTFDQTNNFDIALSILNFETDIELYFGYNRAKFDEVQIARLGQYFEKIANELVLRPSEKINRIEIVSESEKHEIVETFNDTASPYSSEKFIHQLVEEAVGVNPDKTALLFENTQLTYGELYRKANHLAQKLRGRFVDSNVLVPVIMERSAEMIVALLAILKAGYAYVPFEPSLPKNRIQKLLQSLRSPCVVTDEETFSALRPTFECTDAIKNIFCLLSFGGNRQDVAGTIPVEFLDLSFHEKLTEDLPEVGGSNDNVAYVIHTSGSTGLPKGVVVQHKPVINILEWMNRTFQVTTRDRLLFVTSPGFDLSVYDIFGSLAAGASVYITSREEIGNPQMLLKTILRAGITLWDSAPAALQQLVQVADIVNEKTEGNILRAIFLSGDWIGLSLPDAARNLFRDAKVVSLGGATEAVIWSNYFLFDEVKKHWTSIPYGKPIQNARYYIVDDNLNVLPKEMIGELYIGGECLALGYVNEIKLTADKFIANPFIPGGRLYRTGDLARWFNDGNIELIGRKDHQVKIRGFRVELGEIESRLTSYPGINNLILLVDKNKTGDKYIAAFYVSDQPLDPVQLKAFLREELPEYMVPAQFIRVDEIPATVNGKVDRNALMKKLISCEEDSVSLPSTPVAQRVAKIWAEVLNRAAHHITAEANFFDLGGHSLSATILQARLEKEFDIQIPLRKIFNYPVLNELAEQLFASPGKSVTIKQAPVREYYPVTSGQKRLYSLQSLTKNTTVYNIIGCLKIEGEPDVVRMEMVLNKMIQAQESLRTTFVTQNGVILQRIQQVSDFKLQRYTLEESEDLNIDNFVRPFQLESLPLFRVSLIEKRNKNISYLLLDMHHIISDGLSIHKFSKDFMLGYGGNEIAPPAVQYKDYAEWMQSEFYQRKLTRQEHYWLSVFKNKPKRLALPLDFERPGQRSHEGDSVIFTIDGELFENILATVKRTDATLFVVVLSVYKIVLSKICNQKEVVVGTPVANRPHEDLLNIIGFFVNMLALRTEIDETLTFDAFILQLKANTLKAFENQDYPFERLISHVEKQRDPQFNPIFDAVIEFDNLEMPALSLPGLDVAIVPDIIRRADFDLVMRVLPEKHSIKFKLEYCTKLFDRSTIEWMRDGCINMLTVLSDGKTTRLKDVSIFEQSKPTVRDSVAFEF